MGLALVAAGAILLLVAWLTGLTTVNAVLLAGLIFIVLGVVLYVRGAKKAGKY